MKRLLVRTSKRRNQDWYDRCAAHRADSSAPRPGPNPTVRVHHFIDGSTEFETVGADIAAKPVRVSSAYNRGVLSSLGYRFDRDAIRS